MALLDVLSVFEKALQVLSGGVLGVLLPGRTLSLDSLTGQTGVGAVARTLLSPGSNSSDAGSSGSSFQLGDIASSGSSLLSLGANGPLTSIVQALLGSAGSQQPSGDPQQTMNNARGRVADFGLDWATGAVQTVDRNAQGQPRSEALDQSLMTPHVTIQVNTIDSRSFLDHSEEVALAVRRSLLTNNPLGDVL